jgi:outer membrane protein OmpA-like peptidoglycan-associated protein
MKKIIVASIALALILPAAGVRAEDNRTEERIGFGTGLVLGAIAGGPAGAIVAAVGGAWLGDKVNEAQKVPELSMALESSELQIGELRDQLADSNSQLDESLLMLQQQEVKQHKVSAQQSALSGLSLDIMFRTNSSELLSTGIEKLTPVALMLKQFPDFSVQLIGHGDVLGTKEANKLVAEERAIRVKQALLNAGIDKDRINILSLGKTEAEADLDDVEGRALERRVRLQLFQDKATTKPSIAQK